MLEVQVIVNVPDLANAINNLAAAMGGNRPVQVAQPTTPPPVQPAPAAVPPAQPVTPPAPPVPPVQAAFPAPSVPLAAPPQYTVEKIMQAGATLMDAGKINELLALLHSFGVQAVTDLKPEQLGAFATAMRDLGAKI